MVPFRTRIVQGPEMLLAQSYEQFDDSGALTGETYVKTLNDLMTALKDEVARS